MKLFNADSYQKSSIDWLTAVTLKYDDNHGGGQEAMLLTQDHGDEVRVGLLRTLSINWT